MRREGVCLLLREDVQVIVILRGNLGVMKGILGGNGGGRKEGRVQGGSSEKGEGRRRGGRDGGGRGGRRRREAGGGAEKRGEGKGTPGPVDAGVVPGQPREPEDHLEVTQPGHLEGKILGMAAMDPDPGRQVVGDGSSRGRAAVYEF